MLVTGLGARSDRIRGIEVGADDFLTKPCDTEELTARVRSLLRLKRYTDELESAESVILSLALTVEARDRYTDGHCQRLAAYATTLGTELHLGHEEIAALRRGGYLHDVGKIAIPDTVLRKPGRLTSEEWEVMKTHPLVGDRLCGNLRSLALVRPIVRHHHERLDGSGYPDRLQGQAIPVLAQIVAIVDAFDAMRTDRPYRPAQSVEHACTELVEDVRRGLFASDLVDAFVEIVRMGRLAPGFSTAAT